LTLEDGPITCPETSVRNYRWFLTPQCLYSTVIPLLPLWPVRPLQSLSACTGCTGHRGSRGIAVLFLDHGIRRGCGSASQPGRSLPPGKTRYLLYRIEPWRRDPIVCPETSVGITTTRCVITQKNAVLIYFAAEAWNHAWCVALYLRSVFRISSVALCLINRDNFIF